MTEFDITNWINWNKKHLLLTSCVEEKVSHICFFFLSFRTSSTNLQHIKCNNGTFLFFRVYSLNVGFKIIFSIHPYYVRYFCLCSVKMNGRWFCFWQILAFFLVCVTHFITCFTSLGIWGRVSWYRCELKHKIMKRKSM